MTLVTCQGRLFYTNGPRLSVRKPDNFIHWISHYPAQPTWLFDVFGEISAQANDSHTFTFVLYKIHMATLSFFCIFHLLRAAYPVDNALHPLDNCDRGPVSRKTR